MIKQLEMVNVRRHAHTVIDFSGDGQLISLSGSNGAGKSTVLEAILYALYGETRHGRSGIAGMVRRGAEHEGMEVSLSFSLDNVDYEVTRRYEKGKSTASLKASGTEVMRTVAGVSAEITRILGMDVAGFKLATIAKQKELDGLADLTPAKRRAAVSRLLRLDAISAAAKQAREEYVRAKELSDALTAQADVSSAQEKLRQEEEAHAEAEAALVAQRETVESLAQQMIELAGVEAEWNDRQNKLAAARATLDSAVQHRDTLVNERDSVRVPAEVEPTRSVADIDADLAALAGRIAAAQQAAQSAHTRARVQRDLDRAAQELADSVAMRDRTADAEAQLADAVTQRDLIRVELDELLARHADAASAVSAAGARVESARERADQVEHLSAECSLCGQHVSDEVRDQQVNAAHEALSDLVEFELRRKEELTALSSQVAQAREKLEAAEASVGSAQEDYRTHSQAVAQVAQHESVVSSYEDTLTRLPEAGENVDDLFSVKSELDVERGRAVHASEVAFQRREALEHRSRVAALVLAAEEQVTVARENVEACAVPDKLQEDFSRLSALRDEHAAEVELLNACSQAVAAAAGAVRAAAGAVASANALGEEAAKVREQALVASGAHEVLSLTARTLSVELRPALQAEVATLLTALSEGRFSGVQIDEDYSVKVADTDGSWQPVSEYSGGEMDLIALSIRLALAQIVAKRNGAHSSGFLILDEVLGSQDAARRQAILDGLRRLRNTYGQILLISHVGGLEDASDRVISIEDEDGVSVAT